MKSPSPACFLVALAVAGACLPAASQDGIGAKFERVVAESMKDGIVPGMGAALIRDGKVVSIGGYGSTRAAGGEPVTIHTPFHIGSITKTLTAAAVMRLVDDGKVGLDERASRYLPELGRSQDPRAALVTVRQLLSGRGCVANIFEGSDTEAGALERHAVRLMASEQFAVECIPGKGYVYPNFGYVLAGLVVQRVSGMPYEDFVEKRLFAPMGMKDSTLHYWKEGALRGNEGHYRVVSGASKPGHGVMGRSVGPTGMAVCSIHDLARYVQTLLADGVSPDGVRVLSAASVREILSPQGEAESEIAEVFPDIQTRYGLGWELNEMGGMAFTAKGGSIGVMSAYIAILPARKSAVAFVANLVDYGKLQIVFNAFALLAGGEARPYATIPHAPKPFEGPAMDPKLRALLPGRYAGVSHDLGGFTLLERGGTLYMTSEAGELALATAADGFAVRSEYTDYDGRAYKVRRAHGRLEIWQGTKKIAQRPLPAS